MRGIRTKQLSFALASTGIMTYKYETHLHTSETSKCSSSSGAEFVHLFKSLGYTGIFVTDHFLNGNTTAPQDAPWPERVELFCRGYEVAAQEGAKIGLDVFFGWEYSLGWSHFLTYGLGKDWLLANPDLLKLDLLDYLDLVHKDGGSIVHAHPFREGVDLVHLVPNKVDAIEIINGCRSDDANLHASDFATSFDLPRTAGSDIHEVGQKRLCGIVSSQRLSHARDYVAAIKSGEATIFDDAQQ